MNSVLMRSRQLLARGGGVRYLSTSKVHNQKRVGVIGLGNMGYNMAVNLINSQAFKQVNVYDMNPSHVDSLVKIGAHGVRSIEEVGRDSDVVVLMLPSCPIVQNVCQDQGLFKSLAKGAMVIDASTIDPQVSRELAKTAQSEYNLQFLDAPVSGGVVGATNGTLTFMVGSSTEEVCETSKTTVLDYMGKNVVYCGGNGNGLVAKLCNNMLLAIQMVGVSEAMNLGQSLGMDAKVLSQIINTSTGKCWSSEINNPVPGVLPNAPASKEYVGGFGGGLMQKDLGLAIKNAGNVKANIPLGAQTEQLYRLMNSTEKYVTKDFGAIYDFLAPESKKIL